MARCDYLIRDVTVADGSGGALQITDLAISGDRICAIRPGCDLGAEQTIDGNGMVLAPGFIDVHTHDDTAVIRTPQMLPKLSQGVTTVIVGNCGISAAPVMLPPGAEPPDPMNLLGNAAAFCYPRFRDYVDAISAACPAVNVAALVGHTALRSNHLDRLDRAATVAEIATMRDQLREGLACGALGLSTGLAYLSAFSATTEEVVALAEPLAAAGAIYTTHMRSETEAILDAMDEAAEIGRRSRVPVVISHLKCAGVANWGRSAEVLRALDALRTRQDLACDCYPYAAGSSTLDLRQVDERVVITITWSEPFPEFAGQTLAEIARAWRLPLLEAADRLGPAGAIYHSISEEDMQRILRYPAIMIGSDGLPNDPLPHPRLWGTFPRVLGRYCRDLGLFSLPEAIRKMTSLPAATFGLKDRGSLKEGYYADLVLFDPAAVRDTASFADPIRTADGIAKVWVNGVLSYDNGVPTSGRAGRFLPRRSS
jgi:N-acyl-D-amino-acid deacylase